MFVSMNAVLLVTTPRAVQIPSTPLPTAAVEPDCGLDRLGSASPTTGVLDVGDVGDVVVGALAVAGAAALPVVPDELEPPPPQAASANDAIKERERENFELIFIGYFRRTQRFHAEPSCRSLRIMSIDG